MRPEPAQARVKGAAAANYAVTWENELGLFAAQLAQGVNLADISMKTLSPGHLPELMLP